MKKTLSLVALLCACLLSGQASAQLNPAYDGGLKTYSAWLQTGLATLSVTNSSARVALGSSAPVAYVCNTGSAAAYVVFGTVSVVATTAGFPVLPATCVSLVAAGKGYIAAITASSTATLSISTGNGRP